MENKNKSYIGISFIILIFGIYAVPKIFNRISNDDVVRDRRNELEAVKQVKKVSNLVKFNKVPSYQLLNQDSMYIGNDFFKGKVHVVEFFFTTCPTICPIMNKNMKAIEETFIKDADFGIASFTIQPSYDTPSVLKEYMNSYNITMKNWQMLTGDGNAIMELANKGFNIYAAMDDKAPGGFEHSGLFALVDKNGFIRSRKDAYGNPILCYRGIAQETKDEEGKVIDVLPHQLTELKEDIVKLLQE